MAATANQPLPTQKYLYKPVSFTDDEFNFDLATSFSTILILTQFYLYSPFVDQSALYNTNVKRTKWNARSEEQ